MKKMMILILAISLAGCSSMPVKFPAPPDNQIEGKDYKVLGESEGHSVGMMLFGFIPMNQNNRFQKAYNEAVKNLGGDRLLNPTIEERWWWGFIMDGFVFTVKGTVVKDLAKK